MDRRYRIYFDLSPLGPRCFPFFVCWYTLLSIPSVSVSIFNTFMGLKVPQALELGYCLLLCSSQAGLPDLILSAHNVTDHADEIVSRLEKLLLLLLP